MAAGYYSGGTLDSSGAYDTGYNNGYSDGRSKGQEDVKVNPSAYGVRTTGTATIPFTIEAYALAHSGYGVQGVYDITTTGTVKYTNIRLSKVNNTSGGGFTVNVDGIDYVVPAWGSQTFSGGLIGTLTISVSASNNTWGIDHKSCTGSYSGSIEVNCD